MPLKKAVFAAREGRQGFKGKDKCAGGDNIWLEDTLVRAATCLLSPDEIGRPRLTGSNVVLGLASTSMLPPRECAGRVLHLVACLRLSGSGGVGLDCFALRHSVTLIGRNGLLAAAQRRYYSYLDERPLGVHVGEEVV